MFPHKEPRKIQKALIAQIDSCLQQKQNLIVHAPTGIGKTAAVLSPALEYALKNKKTIFFLTPRHSQHKIAIDTLKQIKTKYNLNFNVVDFIGKKWMCPQPGTDSLYSNEFGEYCKEVKKKATCEYHENFKNKINKKITLSKIHSPLHVEEVCNICRSDKICSYEISCELAKTAKVIIADYFHILSPSIRSSLLSKMKKEIQDCVIIFDEAHNLPSRCRDLLTTSISTNTINNAIKEAKKFFFEYEEELLEIQKQLEDLAQETPIQTQESLVKKQDFKVNEEFIADLNTAAETVREEQKRSYLGSVANFLEAWLGADYGFTRILQKGFDKFSKSFISLSYRCLDPAIITQKIKSHSIILMSGTLNPTNMYLDLLGFNKEDTIEVDYISPFPEKNKLSLIIPHTTTKYTERSEQMYQEIAKLTSSISNAIPGNTAIFFPSYNLRDKVYNYFQSIGEKTTFLEHPKLNKTEKQELIDKFKSYSKKGAVLLGASSGSLGEGVDLPGDFLKAVIIVGLPLAKPDLETSELIKYYETRFQKGWDYAYTFPAIIKTLQNAGRCIRSETDKGVIAFIDERYAWPNYKRLLPNSITTLKPKEKINEFFQ